MREIKMERKIGGAAQRNIGRQKEKVIRRE
jgi:hypothetical protein